MPQPPGAGPPRNAIRGEFFVKGETGWAALCSANNSTALLAFRNARDTSPATVTTAEDNSYTGYERQITAVARDFILRHYRAYGGPEPPPIDHQGIDDAFLGKASVTWYFHNGKWLRLQGADEATGCRRRSFGCGRKLPQHGGRIEDSQTGTNPSQSSCLIGRRFRQVQQVAVARHQVSGAAMRCQIQVRFIVRVARESKACGHRIDHGADLLDPIEKHPNLMNSADRIGNLCWTSSRSNTSRSSETTASLSSNSRRPASTSMRRANAGPREAAA